MVVKINKDDRSWSVAQEQKQLLDVTKEDIDKNKAYLLASKAKDINPNMNMVNANIPSSNPDSILPD